MKFRKFLVWVMCFMVAIGISPLVNAGKEIEIRAKLLNREEVISYLSSKGIVQTYENHQIDTYYDNPSCTFFSDPDNVYKWLRIRVESGKITLNFKHWLPEDAPIKTYCEESEFELSSLSDMPSFLPKFGLSAHGYVPIIVVDKLRKSFMYKNCEISIDRVKDLGDYIEIEYKGTSDDVGAVQGLLKSILEEIGAKVGPMDHKGYAYHLIKLKFK